MADDQGTDSPWIDWYDPTKAGDMYEPTDDDRAVIDEPDTRDDVLRLDDSTFDSPNDDTWRIVKTVIKAAEVSIPIIAEVVRQSGNAQAAQALGALSLMPKVASKLYDVAEVALNGGDLDKVAVTVPTSGRNDDALSKVRRAIAASRED